jgi:hypothetical protein
MDKRNHEIEGFDPQKELENVQAMRAAARHRTTWGKSRLLKFRAELIALKKTGGSYADLSAWLKTEKRICVNKTTVMRFLGKQNADG